MTPVARTGTSRCPITSWPKPFTVAAGVLRTVTRFATTTASSARLVPRPELSTRPGLRWSGIDGGVRAREDETGVPDEVRTARPTTVKLGRSALRERLTTIRRRLPCPVL